MMGKSIIDIGKIESLNDVFEQINRVTSIKICDIANHYLQDNQFNSLSYLPK